MLDHRNVYKQIELITAKLISVNLAVAYNFPTSNPTPNNGCEISFSSGQKDISLALKNLAYLQMYNELSNKGNYNIKMIDGALLQFLYRFNSSELESHRLAFFPSPFLEHFQNEPEIYELDEIYADIIAKNILPIPIRFDYDPKNHQNIDHPKCHLTLGQFKNCRIPVCAPITPITFINFILRNFYNTAFKKFTNELNFQPSLFKETITSEEKKLLHLAIY